VQMVLSRRRLLALTVTAAGMVWLCVLLPLELKMRSPASSDGLRRTFLCWNIVGWAVTLALFAIIYVMVQKPA